MTSADIVKLYDAKVSGQQLLIPDDDFILRNTPFKDTGDKQKNREIVVHWWMNVYRANGTGDESVKGNIYSTWRNANYNNFHFARADGTYSLETNQSVVQLSCYRKKKLDAHIYELKMWLPYIKPVTSSSRRDSDNRPRKHISIFESTLSEWGIYSMDIFSDNEISLNKTTYGFLKTFQKFTDLTSAVAYIRDNHYYE